ncbi:MAG: helix-turn-helix domain-containing protein [Alicyclobacillus sp.]|nr:helix-turn-helix domain-containing protein [Alicyclobacillus sp.]
MKKSGIELNQSMCRVRNGVGMVSSIGKKLSELRAKRGWTLKYVSSRTGISVSHLSAMEKGRRPHPSFHNVARLANLYEVPLTLFLDDELRGPEVQQDPFTDHPSGDSNQHDAQEATLAAKLKRLYDADTQTFIASESSRPYVALAKQLADAGNQLDPSSLLQLIAQLIRERQHPY